MKTNEDAVRTAVHAMASWGFSAWAGLAVIGFFVMGIMMIFSDGVNRLVMGIPYWAVVLSIGALSITTVSALHRQNFDMLKIVAGCFAPAAFSIGFSYFILDGLEPSKIAVSVMTFGSWMVVATILGTAIASVVVEYNRAK